MAIVIKSNGKEYKHWSSVTVDLMLDTVASTFLINGYRDSAPELYEPLKYQDIEVWIIDEALNINEKLITGTILNQGLSVQKQPGLESLAGYSKPGILETVTMPQSLYPLQYDNTSLKTIAKRICDKFNLTLKVHEGAIDKANEKFKEVKCRPTESLKSFLSRIGREKGITISHDNLGNLFLYRILNVIPATSKISSSDLTLQISTSPNSQQMHSEITVLREVEPDEDEIEGEDFEQNLSMKHTAKSPFIKNIFLPKTVEMKNGDLGTIQSFAESELAKEAINMPITVYKHGWDFAGRIVRAGFFIEIEAPEILVENTKFVVNRMTFSKTAKGVEELRLTCILPCVYTGVLPSKSPYKTTT